MKGKPNVPTLVPRLRTKSAYLKILSHVFYWFWWLATHTRVGVLFSELWVESMHKRLRIIVISCLYLKFMSKIISWSTDGIIKICIYSSNIKTHSRNKIWGFTKIDEVYSCSFSLLKSDSQCSWLRICSSDVILIIKDLFLSYWLSSLRKNNREADENTYTHPLT